MKRPSIKTIVRELRTDIETPISVYLKLRGKGPSYLLESIEGEERIARYSYIGVKPRSKYVIRGNEVSIIGPNGARNITLEPPHLDSTRFLENELANFYLEPTIGLPRFTGGLVGYLGYEVVRHFEPKLEPTIVPSSLPDGIFLLSDIVIVFDHYSRGAPFLIAHMLDGDETATKQKLDEVEAMLRVPLPNSSPKKTHPTEIQSNMTKANFEKMVRAAKEYILSGDIFQVVLSQRFSRQTSAEPFDIYRAARRLNPSPYMFFFDFEDVDGAPFYLAGASPEMLVRLQDGKASIRPIAGTRPRGTDKKSDEALAADLLTDPKERAEHVMLVDLGRNDLGRVCEYGTVQVSDFAIIERYSHVMHIVSNVEGILLPELTAFDLLRAGFPAGTVSGAPKVRAMEIISELEPDTRGPYAGMVGYFGFDGAMDTCITIRTLVSHGNTVNVQAGAGIVADSDPEREYQETVNKANAMLKAIEIAET